MNIYPIVFNAVHSILGEPTLLTVRRRAYTVGNDGIVTIAQPVEHYVRATIIAIPPNNLDRQPEYQTVLDAIQVITDFPLYGPTKTNEPADYQPDEVVWHGDVYQVTAILDRSKSGRGYTQAVCQAVGRVPGPPLEP